MAGDNRTVSCIICYKTQQNTAHITYCVPGRHAKHFPTAL